MKDKYKVLIVEQLSETVEIIARSLEESSISFEFFIAESKEKFLKGLEDFAPQAILFNNSFLDLSVVEAIEIAKRKQVLIPLIIIANEFDESLALSLVRNGVDDYVLKSQILRLPFALVNSIEKFRHHKEHKQLLYKTCESETLSKQELCTLSNKFSLATSVAGIGIWEYCFKEQKFAADDIVFSFYGVNSGEFDGSFDSWLDLFIKKIRTRRDKMLKTASLIQKGLKLSSGL